MTKNVEERRIRVEYKKDRKDLSDHKAIIVKLDMETQWEDRQ